MFMTNQETSPELCSSRAYVASEERIEAMSHLLIGIYEGTHRGPVKILDVCRESDIEHALKIARESAPGIPVIGLATDTTAEDLPKDTPFHTSHLLTGQRNHSLTPERHFNGSEVAMTNLGKFLLNDHSRLAFYSAFNPYCLRLGKLATPSLVEEFLGEIEQIHGNRRPGIVIVPPAALQEPREIEKTLNALRHVKEDMPILFGAEVSYSGIKQAMGYSKDYNGSVKIDPSRLIQYFERYNELLKKTGLEPMAAVRVAGVCGFSASDKKARENYTQSMCNGTLYNALCAFNSAYYRKS